MGVIGAAKPVKLIVGLISSDEAFFFKAKKALVNKFGQIDFESQIMTFNYTDYYAQEFGTNLKRIFLSFKRLIEPAELAQIKIFTINLEARFSKAGKRTINIDPGYLTLAKLVLASTKDFSHRIYLEKGIYADLTLLFKDKAFKPLEWTYPDYRTKDYIDIFNNLRKIYYKQIQCKEKI